MSAADVAQLITDALEQPAEDLMSPKLLLTISEAAEALTISERGLYRLFSTGRLSWVQVGAHRRVTGSEINRFIAANTKRASA